MEAAAAGSGSKSVKDWRQRLRSDYPDETRFVVQQLIGPLTRWFGYDAGMAAGDEQGMENIRPEDLLSGPELFSEMGFQAVVTPLGLLHGLGALSVVAGAGFEPATFGL